MTEPSQALVSDLGEAGLIDRILSRIGRPEAGVVSGGDDAAAVPGADRILITTDALVENVDFDFSYGSGADVGWKSIAVNASDIAAMCGRPAWATVVLGMPAETRVSTIDGLLEGMLEASARWNIVLVGGDISKASELSITVAMIGSPLGVAPVLRSGARVGDALCVTGSLGGAAAGLRLLRHRGVGATRAGDHPSGQSLASSDATTALMNRQLRPVARVEQAAALASLLPSSMIDLSDGLAVDLARLMRASHTGCRVDQTSLPVDPDLDALFGSDAEAALELAILGGEDFELLFTLGEDRVDAALEAVRATGAACARIGTVTDGECTLGDKPLAAWEGLGWDHLRSR
ncbi:MAG TPA: thiamine-phosphate kinase [Actinomycetota bacterium]|nr:thiamine-phosphate kinase [Actinomycetota bacterium]